MEELKILQKTYDMIKYGNQCLLQFPRAERYALAAEIKQSMYKILRLIIQANKQRNKKQIQMEIDTELDVLGAALRTMQEAVAAIQDVVTTGISERQWRLAMLGEVAASRATCGAKDGDVDGGNGCKAGAC